MEKTCNLLLYSAITRMLPSVAYIKRYFKINPKTAKVLFVPFAGSNNKYYLALCKQALMLAGIQKSNISTLSSHTHKTSKFDIIFVSGGNVCALKDKLVQIDWFNEIRQRILAGTLYIGDSAGAVLLGNTIEHTLKWEPYNNMLANYNGFNIIDKGVVVHYSLLRYSGKNGLVEEPEAFEAHVKQTQYLGEGNFITVANNQVIIARNGKLKNKFFSWRKIHKSTTKESSKYGKR